MTEKHEHRVGAGPYVCPCEPPLTAIFDIERPLALVGMSGCGKSTVGRLLAERLQIAFCDSDSVIGQDAGMSVVDLFSAHGEPDFRRRERKAIRDILDCGCCVLATGGGAYVDRQTADILDARATTIWLDASVDTLLAHIGTDCTRPLLNVPNQSLRERLTAMLESRSERYVRADIRVACDAVSPEMLVDRIVSRLCDRDRA